MLDRAHLNIVKQVEAYGSLTAAAKKLHVTQSALSHSIRKLEDKLGLKIWRREGRGLHLTQAGHYILQTAHRVLPQLEDADNKLRHFARGERGTLRIGMECHPCYQWLLKVVEPFLHQWPDVDVDVKQKFQFGGVGALLGYEIDLLVTPDPYHQHDLNFVPVFDYEQVLVMANHHRLAAQTSVSAQQLREEVLLTYPVPSDRLDIFNYLLNPHNIQPKGHKRIETTEIMLQMVASGRGVAALPRWLALDYSKTLPLATARLGEQGIAKKIHLGRRKTDSDIAYLEGFISLACQYQMQTMHH